MTRLILPPGVTFGEESKRTAMPEGVRCPHCESDWPEVWHGLGRDNPEEKDVILCSYCHKLSVACEDGVRKATKNDLLIAANRYPQIDVEGWIQFL